MKLARKLLPLMSCVLLSGCGMTVKMGSVAYMLRENQLGIAVTPMEDVTIKCWQLQIDGRVIQTKVLFKAHATVRVGINYIVRDDQVLTLEKKKFSAMVPDKDQNLVQSDFTIDDHTGVKIGTATYTPKSNGTSK